MRKTLLINLLLGMALLVNAIPAFNVWQVFRQPDGSSLRLLLVGDEHFHYYITDDSVAVMQHRGAFYYAQCVDGRLRTSSLLAHDAKQRTMEEKAALMRADEMQRLRPRTKRGIQRRRDGKRRTYDGEKKGLVILVDFPDRKFFDGEQDEQVTYNRYLSMLNQQGYTNDLGAIGSVHDYFRSQSGGMFNLSFDLVGPVTMPESCDYYGEDLGANGVDLHVPEMLVEACSLIDEGVDFSEYDWDGDGYVDEVFLLYAGYGQATGGGWSTIWPHMWSLTQAKEEEGVLSGPVAFDGVWVDVYACSNELYGRQGTSQMGIGTICHEFSHCLGLPDLYDVDNSSAFSLGTWDLMSKGNYNGPNGRGWVPAGYSAYERWLAGWLQPVALSHDTLVYDMPPLAEQSMAYVIYNDGHPDEYYLLENRSKTAWDTYLPGQGLLISHVDYDEQAWNDNIVNTLIGFDHRHVTLFQAGGGTTGAKTAYPYQDNDSLTDSSTPAAMLYHPNIDGSFLMHKPISAITFDEESSLVSFQFGNLNVSPTSITAVDGSDNDAAVYTLDGTRLPLAFHQYGNTYGQPSLPPGFYILRFADGSSRKILVH